MWNDRPTQRHDHGWLPDRDRTRERDEELRHRAITRINESASLLRLPPSSPPPASYWYGGHHDSSYISPSTQTMVDNLLERGSDARSGLDDPSSLRSVLQSERRARRLSDRYTSGSIPSSRDRELRERDGQSTSPSVLPPFTDFRTRGGFTPNMGQDMAAPYLRMLRSDHSSRPTIFRPPSPHLAPSRASPQPQASLSTAGRIEASSVGPSLPSPNTTDSTSIFRNFDLSAYTGAPFRASLSTLREMNRRRERGETRSQRYWDHELERDREIGRELNLEHELERERERQRERQMELMREGSMLQSMLSRRRSTGTQARAEDPNTFPTIPLSDPDSMFRRIVSDSFIQIFRGAH